jgi:hypothetical protein
MHLQKLMDLVRSEKKSKPFVCILDLVENGLSADRFTIIGSVSPCRHEITLFIAAWFKLEEFEPEIYRDWLTNYCVDVLSKISSSSASQIRHSTKSSINYIHRSDISFLCNCENNIFKAQCSLKCPIYNEMMEVYSQNLEAERKRIEKYQQIAEENKPAPKPLTVRQRYGKQFIEAVTIIEEYLEKGHTKKEIAIFLNKKEYKTSTGNEWKAATVSRIAIDKGWVPKRQKRKDEKTASVQLKLF